MKINSCAVFWECSYISWGEKEKHSILKSKIIISLKGIAHYTPISITKAKMSAIPSTGEDVEQQEFSFVGGTTTLANSLVTA